MQPVPRLSSSVRMADPKPHSVITSATIVEFAPDSERKTHLDASGRASAEFWSARSPDQTAAATRCRDQRAACVVAEDAARDVRWMKG